MKHYISILVIFCVISCQIEDENAPSPDETYVKYYGELTSHEASDIEIVYDATGTPEGFVVFGTQVTDNGDNDFFVLRTDLEGNHVNSVTFGLNDTLDILDTLGRFTPNGDSIADDWTGDGVKDRFFAEEEAGQIHFVSDFGNGVSGYAVIGTSSITINAIGVSDWKFMSFGFLNRDLEPVSFRGDSVLVIGDLSNDELLDFIGNDIIQLNTGGFLMVGGREIDRGNGDSDFDNLFIRFNLQNGVIFQETQGIPGDDEEDILVRAFQQANGNLVMIGSSNTPSFRGENGGLNGTNVFFLETDINGTPSNPAVYGIEDSRNDQDFTVYNETVNAVIKTETGYSIVGTSNTSDNEQYAFIMNLTNSGVYSSGSAHHFSTFNDGETPPQTVGLGITQTLDNKLVMLGQYLSFSTGVLSRGGEGMFAKFDQGSVPVEGAESFFGLSDGNDEVVDAVTLPDGKIVAVANVDFGGGVKLISIIKLNDDGSLD